MPRINRRTRTRFRNNGGLTDEQRGILLENYCIPFNDADETAAFEDEKEMRRLWNAHRDALMMEPRFNGAGRRPYGFFRFELGVNDDALRGEYAGIIELLRRNLLNEVEMVAVETRLPELGPIRKWLPDLPDFARMTGERGIHELRALERDHLHISEFHRHRGRPSIAGHYQNVAAAVAEWLAMNEKQEEKRSATNRMSFSR